MVHYKIISTDEYSQYIGHYTGYGIEGIYPDGATAGIIKDISEEKEYVEMIIQILNSGGAEAVHFKDIVEDILAEKKQLVHL
jgi:hypothetical protein